MHAPRFPVSRAGRIAGAAFTSPRRASLPMTSAPPRDPIRPWRDATLAAAAILAVAWMGLKERLVSRWIGAFSILPVLTVVLTVGLFGLPGFPGVVSGLWLVVTFAGLALGRSPINR